MNKNNDELHIKIDYNKPIEITDLYLSLRALQNLYSSMSNDKESKLFVKEINKGSIDFVLLVAVMNQILFPMAATNTIVHFYNFLGIIIDKLKNKKTRIDKKEHMPSDKDCKKIKPLISTIQNVEGNLNIYLNSNKQTATGFTYEDAPPMIETIKEIEKKSNIKKLVQTLFKWSVVNMSSAETGNKGIIVGETDKPVKVIFAKGTNIKREMSTGYNWQDYNYIVDVEITYENDIAKVYRITNNYHDEKLLDD